MKKSLLLIILSFISIASVAQTAYAFRVSFSDKSGGLTIADSSQFLSQKSLDRRSKQGIAVSTNDIPVVDAYVNGVMTAASAVKLHNKSRWFNQIVVITYDSTKWSAINSLSYVNNVELVASYFNYSPKPPKVDMPSQEIKKSPESFKVQGDPADYGVSFQQIDLMEGDCLHDLGFYGNGLSIAVFDAGFKGANTLSAFDSLNMNGQILGEYNFVDVSNDIYNVNYGHGMNVLGCMGANLPGTYVGTSPKADYYLLLTEDIGSEQPIEMDNWLSAAEWADSAGVDLINSSLGYNEFDAPHTSFVYATDFDGKSTLVTKAANMAMDKGIFVVNAQGNTGNSPWVYMLAPADGDSILSVGMVDGSGLWGGSGYGPNAAGNTKPDVVGLGAGAYIIAGNGQTATSNGSSFSAPMVCGSVACLWQAFPNLDVYTLKSIIQQNSSIYSSPNTTLGYGIPDFCATHNMVLSVDNFESAGISIFPNPSNGRWTIEVGSDLLPLNYKLYNLNGQLLRAAEGNSERIVNSDLESQPEGLYFLILETPKGLFQQKIIKRAH